jgi:hypothetical protein
MEARANLRGIKPCRLRRVVRLAVHNNNNSSRIDFPIAF